MVTAEPVGARKAGGAGPSVQHQERCWNTSLCALTRTSRADTPCNSAAWQHPTSRWQLPLHSRGLPTVTDGNEGEGVIDLVDSPLRGRVRAIYILVDSELTYCSAHR